MCRNCRATRYSRRKRRRSSAVAPFLRLRLLRFCACSVVAALASIRQPRLMKGFTLCCRRPGVCGRSVLALEIAPLLPLLCALALCSCVAPPLRGTNERWRPSQFLGLELFDGGQVSFFVRGRHKVHCLDSSFAFKIAVKGGQSRPREANRGQGVAKGDQLFGLDWPQF